MGEAGSRSAQSEPAGAGLCQHGCRLSRPDFRWRQDAGSRALPVAFGRRVDVWVLFESSKNTYTGLE